MLRSRLILLGTLSINRVYAEIICVAVGDFWTNTGATRYGRGQNKTGS